MRNIFTVNATQVVVSEAHPEGLLSVVSGYPINFDSENYEGDIELTMKMAKGNYYKKLGQNYEDINPNRVMKTVTLENAMGQQILSECVGRFPDTEPEPTPEEPVEE